MTPTKPKSDCPYPQEPRIGGNSGNSGNSQAGRGFQAFPPNKKSGNKWEHTIAFQYKGEARLPVSVMTVPTKSGVGTEWEQKNASRSPGLYGLFPLFPLFPPFSNSQEHLVVSFQSVVAP